MEKVFYFLRISTWFHHLSLSVSSFLWLSSFRML